MYILIPMNYCSACRLELQMLQRWSSGPNCGTQKGGITHNQNSIRHLQQCS